MNTIRILLADDHALVRGGIRALLQKIPDFKVVAEAEDGAEALRLITQHKPDIALLDISMPTLDGISVAAQVAKLFPEVRVIILSMHTDHEYVLRALRAGAKGYLIKGARASELELAVNAVARGETYLSPSVSHHVIADVVDQDSQNKSSPLNKLTPRQRQVLQLIAEGRTRKEIAQKLQISSKTIDTYRAQLMDQLDIHDVAGLVRFAITVGIVSMDQQNDNPA